MPQVGSILTINTASCYFGVFGVERTTNPMSGSTSGPYCSTASGKFFEVK